MENNNNMINSSDLENKIDSFFRKEGHILPYYARRKIVEIINNIGIADITQLIDVDYRLDKSQNLEKIAELVYKYRKKDKKKNEENDKIVLESDIHNGKEEENLKKDNPEQNMANFFINRILHESLKNLKRDEKERLNLILYNKSLDLPYLLTKLKGDLCLNKGHYFASRAVLLKNEKILNMKIAEENFESVFTINPGIAISSLAFAKVKLAEYSLLFPKQLTPDEEKNKEFTINKYKEALQYYHMLRNRLGGKNKIEAAKNSSNIGSINYELAKLEDGKGDKRNIAAILKLIGEADISLKKAGEGDYVYAYFQQAALGEFVKKNIIDRRDIEEAQRANLNEIVKFGWNEAITKIFEREDIKKYFRDISSGGSKVFEWISEEYSPMTRAIIIKKDKKETIEKEFAITDLIYSAYREAWENGVVSKKDVKFSRPLGTIQKDNESYLVLKRNHGKNLEDFLKNKDYLEKEEIIRTVLTQLNIYYKIMNKRLAERKDNSKEDENIKIKEFSFIENLAERLLVGREERIVQDTLKKLEDAKFDEIKCDEKRIGINKYFGNFFEAYMDYIKKNREYCSLKLLLHSDLYIGNILEDGTLIDPKYLCIGNPLFDVSYFLENIAFYSNGAKDFDSDKKRYLSEFFDSLRNNFGFDENKLKNGYDIFAFHNLICHISGIYKLGKLEEAQFYYKNAEKLLEKNGLKELKDKFTKYIQNTKFFEEVAYSKVKKELDLCIENSEPKNFVKHSYVVESWVKKIKPEASLTLKMAALGHDIERGYIKDRTREDIDYKDYKEQHAQRSVECIKKVFERENIISDFTEDVLYLIRYHEVGLPENDRLYEDMLVLKDADAIAFFEEKDFDLYLKLWGKETTEKKIKYSYDRLTDRAKILVEPLYSNAIKKLAL